MFHSVKYASIIALGLTVAGGGLSSMAAAADFYKGKTLTTLISGAAGGNTNLQARTLMRFMQKYIPGDPRIVNRNMGGSGGLLAPNFVGEVAPRDGTTTPVTSTFPIVPAFSPRPTIACRDGSTGSARRRAGRRHPLRWPSCGKHRFQDSLSPATGRFAVPSAPTLL